MSADPEYVKQMRNQTVRLDRTGDYWTEEDIKRLRECFGEGTGITDISITLQRTEPAVMQQIEKLDLYNRKENPQRSRSNQKHPGCLCDRCPHYQEACPNRERCPMSQEEK